MNWGVFCESGMVFVINLDQRMHICRKTEHFMRNKSSYAGDRNMQRAKKSKVVPHCHRMRFS